MKLLILPDIHGRKFWKEPCQNIDHYDKVIFLGDYLDPYGFEGIKVADAIDNFKSIIELKRHHMDKVVLLLGNHDMPYFSQSYYRLSRFHSRHSHMHHNEIAQLFMSDKDLFQIAFVCDDILFTHAGVTSTWLYDILKYNVNSVDANEISKLVNGLIDTNIGLERLYMVSTYRGGYDYTSSCIWADCDETKTDYIQPTNKLKDLKQVFGHSLQAFYNKNNEIVYGNALEFGTCKMVDTASAYVLDTETFTIEKIGEGN